MKLSVVIICWNDWAVIENCLRSVLNDRVGSECEVIVSDNGSSDGSVENIREQFPTVRVVENRSNLGFAKGNNAGIKCAQGEYILILNPDTIVHEGSLERWMAFAAQHPEAGAFGCRVENPDGSYQESARPFPTIRRSLIAAFYLRPMEYFSSAFQSDRYYCWYGDTEREVDWQSGCCVLFRRDVLRQLGGFDERFFYHFEEVDLCRRVWDAGYRVIFTPEASITHLGGQSVGRFPVRFALETSRNRYRYFHKYFGERGARRCRQVLLAHLRIRQAGYHLLYCLRPNSTLKSRLETLRVAAMWNRQIDPIAFVKLGLEPQMGVRLANSPTQTEQS